MLVPLKMNENQLPIYDLNKMIAEQNKIIAEQNKMVAENNKIIAQITALIKIKTKPNIQYYHEFELLYNRAQFLDNCPPMMMMIMMVMVMVMVMVMIMMMTN